MDKPRTKKRKKDPSQGGKRAPESALATGNENASQSLSGKRGIPVLKEAMQTLGAGPGVYRMLDAKGEVLYVGKARNLKRRVTTYSQPQRLPIRLQRMVQQTTKLEVVTTASEVEALLLESNMIKRHMPRFNVLLRDDKSFPYILLTKDEGVPRIAKHRGQQTVEGDYFGPFASAGAVDRTITALEKAFLLRSCSDATFKSRQRPCLLYQIKRCAGPCVGMVDASTYAALVAQARAFLKEGDNTIQRQLAAAMEEAAGRQDYEAAATYRDRIKALAHIQSSQSINVEGVSDADVLAAAEDGGQISVQVFFFRAGRNYGNRAYFPQHDKDLDIGQVLAAFVLQFYDSKPAPRLVLLSHPLPQQNLIAEALSQRSTIKVELLCPQRGARRQLVESATLNAREALSRRLAEKGSQQRLLEQLADRLGLEAPPNRIEIYDNSHLQGDNAYGAMVVAGPDGFQKNAYRQFSIKKEGTAGDDYAMMREVLLRRFQRAMKEDPDRHAGQWPDLVLLDGGKGQLSAALDVMNELGLSNVAITAVAKGPERDAGRERLFLPDKPSFMLEPRDPVLYFIQRLRDEAHRFAIGTHRRGRAKSRLTSILDEVKGIGAKRKRALLLHFGSAASVSRAGLADLMAAPGISEAVARKIYNHFH